MKRTLSVFGAVVALFAISMAAQPARAAIQCEGTAQVTRDGLIVTPYCEDNYIAYVANRYYGMRVSAYAIRNNPSVKADVCHQIGHDIRVNSACRGYMNENPDFLR